MAKVNITTFNLYNVGILIQCPVSWEDGEKVMEPIEQALDTIEEVLRTKLEEINPDLTLEFRY